MISNALLLSPSHGLGGGIERYTSTIEASLDACGIPFRRLNLRDNDRPASVFTKLGFMRTVTRAVSACKDPTQLILAHRNLLPVIYPAALQGGYAGATVILHGDETWSARRRRASLALRRPDVRVVAGSGFTAGALAPICRANILHPGVPADWYRMLVDAGVQHQVSNPQFDVVTAFRLGDWRNKGLPTIIDAVELLGDKQIRLTICGSGQVPAELRDELSARPWCTVEPNLTDQALAKRLARADLFVLATRTRSGARACGEGFGLALLEAQLTGTPVIAPAYGGSCDAFQHGVTGLSPMDETPQALCAVMRKLRYDDECRSRMARAAAAWSQANFDPAGYAGHVVQTLLGGDRW